MALIRMNTKCPFKVDLQNWNLSLSVQFWVQNEQGHCWNDMDLVAFEKNAPGTFFGAWCKFYHFRKRMNLVLGHFRNKIDIVPFATKWTRSPGEQSGPGHFRNKMKLTTWCDQGANKMWPQQCCVFVFCKSASVQQRTNLPKSLEVNK